MEYEIGEQPPIILGSLRPRLELLQLIRSGRKGRRAETGQGNQRSHHC